MSGGLTDGRLALAAAREISAGIGRTNGNRANGGSTRVAPVVSPSKEEGLEWSVVVTWAS